MYVTVYGLFLFYRAFMMRNTFKVRRRIIRNFNSAMLDASDIEQKMRSGTQIPLSHAAIDFLPIKSAMLRVLLTN